MATTTSIRPQGIGGLTRLALIVIGALALYFAYAFVMPYFVWSEESYGYYWQHRVPLLFHVTGGLVALLVGVFQLWSGMNGKAMRTHPLTGRLYFAAVIVGSIGGIVLSITSAVFGFAWGVALFSLAVAWLAITCMAVYCIRRRDITAHRQWMTRSYIVTFAFVTFRIGTDYVPYDAWGISRDEMSNALIWTVWVMPLIAYEIYLQLRRR